MPLYEYQCTECGTLELCIAGADDLTVTCICGGLMLRLDKDMFKPYFEEKSIAPDSGAGVPACDPLPQPPRRSKS